MTDEHKKNIDKDALEYHSYNRAGKIEVTPTKPCITQADLSLAYTPGVAAPCLEIAKDPENAFKYTAKGNLVGVISNGTAVLGLGNIGPLASKPVMEGKGILFKRFADIDVFDIEVNETTVEGMVKVVSALEPTFGGINLEDIKAPECFEIERQLIEIMDIPVFHDDQHGTAIIASAGFINAIEISKRKIGKTKIVFSGAGAAAMACAKLFFDLGVKKENLIMCDSRGVIYKGREAGMNVYKEEFAIETKLRTLGDALKKADAFIGCSAKGVLTKDMVKTMAKTPIIFAMANPEPEIYPHEVFEVRKDAIVATGRSDFPNQVNNVLGFPFIFRGALDVRAKKINKEMKLAAVKALADLAKEEVPDEVRMAYGDREFVFGPEYLIPTPFDPRVLTQVSPAVAKAAMDSGVARIQIPDIDLYAHGLESKFGPSAAFAKSLKDRLSNMVKTRDRRFKMIYTGASSRRVLNAIDRIAREGSIEPILLGNRKLIELEMEALGLDHLKELEIITPENDERFEEFCKEYYISQQRKGLSEITARELMQQENYFGATLVKKGFADCLLAGPSQTYPELFVPLMNIIGTRNNSHAAGIFIMIFKNKVLFLADCTAQINPSAENLSEIASSTTTLYRQLMKKEPRVAFLSFSNFGSNNHPEAKLVKKAVKLTKEKYPEMMVDGEIQADVAVNKGLINKLFPFSDLKDEADVLIFPDLSSANISYKLISQLSDVKAVGPILVPMNHSVNIIQRTTTVSEVVNMSMLTALLTNA